MKILLIITSLFFIKTSLAQNKSIDIPVYREKDTTLWFISTKENIKKIGLQDLVTTREPVHFRLWTERQTLDVWTIDNKSFAGKFVNYTKRHDPDKYKTNTLKPEKFYSKVDAIDTATARQLFEFLEHLQVFQVPSHDNIKGWSSGTDGNTYLIEYSTPTQYTFKTYWTPEIQIKKGIKEAAIIDSAYKYLNLKMDMNKRWSTFIDGLPIGCYHAGSFFLTCNNTNKNRRKKR